jgi:NADH-quinone oxidoreductase subunit H
MSVAVQPAPRPAGQPGIRGRIAQGLIVALVVLALLLVLGVVTDIIPWFVAWTWGVLGANNGVIRFAVAVVAVLLFTVPTAFVIIFMELKIIAFMNLRIGPNRTGPWGTFSSLFHGFKVLSKEDFTPLGVDVVVFTLAPVVTFVATVMVFLVIPFGPGLVGQDMNIAALYLFAMSGLTVVGLLMGGWASYNKYSLLGGLRSAAQLVTYEIPLALSVVGVVMLAGTMSLNGIIEAQSRSFLDWYVVRQPLAFGIFFLAATAEANRTPFDMSVADQELVGGFATEYSGMRFGFFYFAEYVSVFVVSALAVIFFFGGWMAPFGWPWPLPTGLLDFASLGLTWIPIVVVLPPVAIAILSFLVWVLPPRPPFWQAALVGAVLFTVIALGGALLLVAANVEAVVGLFWFMTKCYAFVFTFVWMRATLPRIRIDQLMGVAWKWLLPAALINIFVTALAVLVVGK